MIFLSSGAYGRRDRSRGLGKGRYGRRHRSRGLGRDRYGCRHRSGGLGRDRYGRRHHSGGLGRDRYGRGDRFRGVSLVRRLREADGPFQVLGGVDREDPLLMVGRLVPAEPAVALVEVVLLVYPEAVGRVIRLRLILHASPIGRELRVDGVRERHVGTGRGGDDVILIVALPLAGDADAGDGLCMAALICLW